MEAVCPRLACIDTVGNILIASSLASLQHPWMTDTGVASDKPLENEIQQRLKKFQNLNKLKRQALKLIASYMPPDEVQGLRNQFQALDKDGNGASRECGRGRLRCQCRVSVTQQIMAGSVRDE